MTGEENKQTNKQVEACWAGRWPRIRHCPQVCCQSNGPPWHPELLGSYWTPIGWTPIGWTPIGWTPIGCLQVPLHPLPLPSCVASILQTLIFHSVEEQLTEVSRALVHAHPGSCPPWFMPTLVHAHSGSCPLWAESGASCLPDASSYPGLALALRVPDRTPMGHRQMATPRCISIARVADCGVSMSLTVL